MTTESKNNKSDTTTIDDFNAPRQRNRNLEARGPLYIPTEILPNERYHRWDYYNSLNATNMEGLGYKLVNVANPIYSRLKAYAAGRGWVHGSIIVHKGKDVELALFECPIEIRKQADDEIKRESLERRKKTKPEGLGVHTITHKDVSDKQTIDYLD